MNNNTHTLVHSFTLGYILSFFNEYFIHSEKFKYPRESEEQIMNLFYLNLTHFNYLFNQVLNEDEIISQSVSGAEDFRIFFTSYFEYIKEIIDNESPESIRFAFFIGSVISLILISGPMDFKEKDLCPSLFLFFKDIGIEREAECLLKKARLFLSDDDELRRIARDEIIDIFLGDKEYFCDKELLASLDSALYLSRLLH